MAGDISRSGGSRGDRDHRHEVPQAPLALYRRYRPATFAEVKGQDHVTEPLRQALRSGRVNHAYLFSGPRGCGKTSSARILARSLNCEEGPTPDPCGKCDSCVALAPSGPGSIDVIEIDAASHGGIDDARDLRERAFYSPVAARFKIYIIDEAHMVTGAGFNALLKLVEEPPPHLKFVFATTEPEKVIPTIRSRTHHYPFRLVPPAVLRELLEEILAAEGVSYEPAVLPVVIRAGAGSVRDSLSVLDQLMAGADESGLRYDRAIALLGYTDGALLDEMAEAFAAGDGAAVFLSIDHVVEAGHDPRRFAMDLLDRLRDLIVLAAVPDAGTSGLLDAPEDQLDRMRKQAAGFGQERLARAAETISTGLVEMRGATSPRLLLELMCAQVLLPAAAPAAAPAPAQPAEWSGSADLAARVERLERQLASGGGQVSSTAGRRQAPPADRDPAGQAAAAGQRPAASPGTGSGQRPASGPGAATGQRPASGSGPGQDQRPGESARGTSPDSRGSAGQPAGERIQPPPGPGSPATLDTETLRGRWTDVLDAVREVRKTAWILLSSYARVEAVEGSVLTIAFDTEGNAKGFASSGSDSYLAEVLTAMFGVQLVIRTIVGPAAGRSAARAVPAPADGSQGGGDGGAGGQAGGAPRGTGPGTDTAARRAAPSGATASDSDGRSSHGGDTDGRDSHGRESSRAEGSPRGQRGGATDEGPSATAGAGSAGTGSAGTGSARADAGPGRGGAGVSPDAVPGRRPAAAPSHDGPPASGQAQRAGGRGSGSRGPAAAAAPAADPVLADDPRPLTDPTPTSPGDNVTGEDLIMRELGGRVIEEIS